MFTWSRHCFCFITATWSRHCFCSILEIRIFRLREVNSLLQHQELVSTRLRIDFRSTQHPCLALSHYPLLLYYYTPSHTFPFVTNHQAAWHECKTGGLRIWGWVLVLWFWAVQCPSDGGAGARESPQPSSAVSAQHCILASKSLNLSERRMSRSFGLKQQ